MEKENIKLSIVERELLSNQFKILERLDGGNIHRDYSNLIKVLEQGYELHYEDVFDNISDESLSHDNCKFVLDVLEMFRGIIYSLQALKRDGKETTLKEQDVRFTGFDGNNETKYMLYTRFFIKDMERFSEIDEISYPDYNSHSKMIPLYKEMLSKWNEICNDGNCNQYMMSEDQIKRVLGRYKPFTC